jgi:hypothetical protein
MKRISSQPPVREDWADFREEGYSQYLSINIGCPALSLSLPQTRHPDLKLKSSPSSLFGLKSGSGVGASILKSANYYQTEFDQMVIITDLPQS